MIKERILFVRDLLFYHKLLRRPKIFWATIYPNYSCNYRCRHCYGSYGETYGAHYDPDTRLDFDQIRFIVEKLHKYGCRYIAFLGGEPLLHKDLKRTIHFVKSLGIELSIVTNGSLVKKRINDLGEVSTLCFSIDGDEESNDFLRGKGAYSRSMQAISAVTQYPSINIHINATIHKGSVDNMGDLFEYAKKNNIYLGFCPLMYQSYLSDDDGYLRPSDQDYRKFYNKVIWLKRRNYPIMYSIESYKTMLNWPDFDKVIIWKDDALDMKDINFPKCYAGQNYIYIGAHGDVYPCSQLVGMDAFSPKNIFRDGFENAWYNAMDIPCKMCTSIGFLDINRMLSFRFRSLYSMTSQSLKEFWFRYKRLDRITRE